MPQVDISELELEIALVENGVTNAYLIVNETPRVCVVDANLRQVGVFSTSVVDREAPRWKENPDAWMFWQPNGVSNPIYIERTSVEAVERLISTFLCQTRWHPETQFPNIASFCVYPLKHSQLLQPLHA